MTTILQHHPSQKNIGQINFQCLRARYFSPEVEKEIQRILKNCEEIPCVDCPKNNPFTSTPSTCKPQNINDCEVFEQWYIATAKQQEQPQ